MSDLAGRIARVLVYRSECWCEYQRKTHLCIISKHAREEPPFSYHWQRKNAFGCTWLRHERIAAISWAKAALEDGYTVFYGVTRTIGGGGGRGLKDGLSPDDEDNADRWFSTHPILTGK